MRRTILSLAGFALALAAQSALAAPAHYDIDATVDAGGNLSAKVVLDLPAEEAQARSEFLLGERFVVRDVDAPGALVTYEPTAKPIAGLKKVVVTYPQAPTRPVKLKFSYHGPLNVAAEANAPTFQPKAVELRLEAFWVPTRSDISLLYTVDAAIAGLSKDLLPVGQGQTRWDGAILRIQRDMPDVDTPLVAMAGFAETATPGMEFYGPTARDEMVEIFRTHAIGSAKYLQDWLGPIPNGPTRIAVISRVGGSSYARRGYIVISRPTPGDPDKTGEIAHGRHVAHEFAHAWFLAADPTSEHYWLVESLAEYCAVRYAEAAYGPAGRDLLIEAKRERAKTAGPVIGGARASRAALYQKAPLLLFELEARIGRPAMDRIFVQLAKKPPRLSSEFFAVLRDVAGDDEARRFEAELRAA